MKGAGMSGQALAFAATACCLLATAGWALVTTPGAAARHLTPRPAARRRRGSLIALAFDSLGRRLAPRVRPLVSPRRERLMRQRVDASGRAITFESYLGKKATWATLLGAFGLLLTLSEGNPVFAAAFAALGWLLPDFSVAALVSRRQHRITRDLPDFLDVLVVVVAAGTGFQEALDRVAGQLGGPLADEMRTTLAEIDLGLDRGAAFKGLRDRNESEALGSFVGALLQADELGVPLAKTLTEISTDLRRTFSQEARTRAARSAPRISLVVTSTLVPATAILIVAAFIVSSGVTGAVFGGG
jgi:tight adherence protein C